MSQAKLTFEVCNDPSAADARIVSDGLDGYNFAAAPLADVRPLAAFARQPSGEVLGGVIARTWSACCEIQELWVAPDHRRAGIASRLLSDVEQRAGTRGAASSTSPP